MAFTSETFIPMSSMANSDAGRAFSYTTADNTATTEGANYYDSAAAITGGLGLRTGDFIYVTQGDGTDIYQVAVSGAGVVTLPLSVAFA